MDSKMMSYACLVTVIYVLATECAAQCKFDQESSKVDKRINKLVGKRYKTVDRDQKYTYFFGICTDALPSLTGSKNAAVIQMNNTAPSKKYVIGTYSNVKLMEGTDWIVLEYRDGDPYGSHCGHEKRKAVIMMTCDAGVSVGNEEIKIYEEENDKAGDCYYLFEMATSAVCPEARLITVSLSVGTILLIVFLSVTALYFILGFLYNRFVLHAKGKDQIPNYEFWKDFGNLEADGCDLVCRTKRNQERMYKGIGDDQLQEEEERDEHLLPM